MARLPPVGEDQPASTGLPEEFTPIPPEDVKLGEVVGTGTTAEVFRGTCKGYGEVAIKQIKCSKRGSDLKKGVAFTREVAVMEKVKHENLVNFFGISFATDQRFMIITELCLGGDCFDLLHNNTEVELVWAQKRKMCSDVAKAMEYLHLFKPQIIHRDLKSLNILLANPVKSRRDMPFMKISDFGLARMKESGQAGDWEKLTQDVGTMHWMAPEVHTGRHYNEKADIYSYAMVLFEIICREIPFDEYSPQQVSQATMKGERPTLDNVPIGIPDEAVALIEGCWREKPSDRPSFTEILKALTSMP